MINQAYWRPGHATRPSTCPVEAIRPLIHFKKEHAPAATILYDKNRVIQNAKCKTTKNSDHEAYCIAVAGNKSEISSFFGVCCFGCCTCQN